MMSFADKLRKSLVVSRSLKGLKSVNLSIKVDRFSRILHHNTQSNAKRIKRALFTYFAYLFQSTE